MSVGGRVSLLALAAAALLAGCGGDDEGTIPAADADKLTARLSEVENGVAAGQCENAQASADLFVEQVDLLPAEVDDKVKQGLREGGERLQELATEQCEEPPPTGASGEEGFQPQEPVEEPAIEPTEANTDPEQQPPPDEGDDGGDDSSGQDGGGSDNAGGNQGGGNQGSGTGTGGVGGGGD